MAGQGAGGWGTKGLPFLAVGKVKGAVRLAYYLNTDTTTDSQQATMDVFTKLLAAAASKLSPGQRTRLQWNDGSVCCLMDPKGELLYCVVTSLLTYPERLAYQMLYDLQAYIQQDGDVEDKREDELQQRLEPKMKELVKYYEDSSNFPQFALGMSRDSSASIHSAASVPPETNNSGRNVKIIVGLLVVVAIAVGIFLFINQSSQAVATEMVALADENTVKVVGATRIGDLVNVKALRGTVAKTIMTSLMN